MNAVQICNIILLNNSCKIVVFKISDRQKSYSREENEINVFMVKRPVISILSSE